MLIFPLYAFVYLCIVTGHPLTSGQSFDNTRDAKEAPISQLAKEIPIPKVAKEASVLVHEDSRELQRTAGSKDNGRAIMERPDNAVATLESQESPVEAGSDERRLKRKHKKHKRERKRRRFMKRRSKKRRKGKRKRRVSKREIVASKERDSYDITDDDDESERMGSMENDESSGGSMDDEMSTMNDQDDEQDDDKADARFRLDKRHWDPDVREPEYIVSEWLAIVDGKSFQEIKRRRIPDIPESERLYGIGYLKHKKASYLRNKHTMGGMRQNDDEGESSQEEGAAPMATNIHSTHPEEDDQDENMTITRIDDGEDFGERESEENAPVESGAGIDEASDSRQSSENANSTSDLDENLNDGLDQDADNGAQPDTQLESQGENVRGTGGGQFGIPGRNRRRNRRGNRRRSRSSARGNVHVQRNVDGNGDYPTKGRMNAPLDDHNDDSVGMDDDKADGQNEEDNGDIQQNAGTAGEPDELTGDRSLDISNVDKDAFLIDESTAAIPASQEGDTLDDSGSLEDAEHSGNDSPRLRKRRRQNDDSYGWNRRPSNGPCEKKLATLQRKYNELKKLL